jgi:ABC-type transport system involved in multi-copper enzyme maturation permease subunit
MTMIWLTWRQFRAQAWVMAVGLAVVAAALVGTGVHLSDLYATSGVAACQGHSDCGTLAANFLTETYHTKLYTYLFFGGLAILYAVPAVIGVFWGAPLVSRELEAGTFRLTWNQSVTRTRWLAAKLALIGLTAMASTGLLSLVITWWASPIDQSLGLGGGLNRLTPLLFGVRGITPVGYAAFAFALGVTAGVVIARTLPAMAVTFAVFTGALITMSLWVRQHLISPLSVTSAFNASGNYGMMINNGYVRLTPAANMPGAWVLSSQVISTSGHVFTGPAPAACLSNSATFNACQSALGKLHLRQLVIYQPASRFWAFQWFETAIFLALALALAGVCFWWVRRRLS